MAEYLLTKRATEDLADIWQYTVDIWSERQADTYYSMLIGSCQDIADRRVSGRQYEDIFSGLLGITTGKHIIFYRQIDEVTVEITRILHERMDLKNRITE